MSGLQTPLLFCCETGQGPWAGGDWGSEHPPRPKVLWGLGKSNLKSRPEETLGRDSNHWPLVCCLVEWAAGDVVLGPEGRVAFLPLLVSLMVLSSERAPVPASPYHTRMLSAVPQERDHRGGRGTVEEAPRGSSRTLDVCSGSSCPVCWVNGSLGTSWLIPSNYMTWATNGQAGLAFLWSHGHPQSSQTGKGTWAMPSNGSPYTGSQKTSMGVLGTAQWDQ